MIARFALLVAVVAVVAEAGEVEPLQQPDVKFAELLPRGENRLQMSLPVHANQLSAERPLTNFSIR